MSSAVVSNNEDLWREYFIFFKKYNRTYNSTLRNTLNFIKALILSEHSFEGFHWRNILPYFDTNFCLAFLQLFTIISFPFPPRYYGFCSNWFSLLLRFRVWENKIIFTVCVCRSFDTPFCTGTIIEMFKRRPVTPLAFAYSPPFILFSTSFRVGGK